MRGKRLLACALLSVAALTGCNQTSGAPTAAPAPSVSPAETAAMMVKHSMQEKFDTDPELAELNLRVDDVLLVNKSGNEFKGLASVETQKGADREISVEVTFDGDNVLWEMPPGALLFAMEEYAADARPPAAAPPPPPSAANVLQPSRGGQIYVATKSGKTRCQIRSTELDCQSQFTHTPFVGSHRANGVTFRSDGSYEWVVGDLGDIPVVQLDYRTYRAFSWKIEASHAGTRFTHDVTGRSIFVSVDKITMN